MQGDEENTLRLGFYDVFTDSYRVSGRGATWIYSLRCLQMSRED